MANTNTEWDNWAHKVRTLYKERILAKELKYRHCTFTARGATYELDNIQDQAGNLIAAFIEEV